MASSRSATTSAESAPSVYDAGMTGAHALWPARPGYGSPMIWACGIVAVALPLKVHLAHTQLWASLRQALTTRVDDDLVTVG